MADSPVPPIPVAEAAPANDTSLADLVRSQAAQIAQLIAALETQGQMLARAFEARAEVAPVVAPVVLTDGAALWRDYIAALGSRTWIDSMQSMMQPVLRHFWPSLITYRARWRGTPVRLPVAGPDMAVETMAPHHWTEFRRTMNTKSVTYRNMVLVRLRAFFSWAENDGRIKFHPLVKAKPEDRRPRRETTITDAQCAAILAAQPHPYFQAIMALASHTGMRRDEVRTLRWDQIDLGSGRIRLSWTTTKSRKSRDLYVDPTDILMLHELRAWVSEHRTAGPSEFLFPKPRANGPISRTRFAQWFRKACDEAGVQAAPGDVRVHFHDATRHTFATDFLRRGGDIRVLQKILGHASLSTTQLYVHSNQEEVRRGFEELHRTMRKPTHSSD